VFPLKDNIPTDSRPYLTIAFIAINVLVYFLLQSKGAIFSGPSDSGVVDYGAIPYEITHPGEGCEATRDGRAIQCGDGIGGPATILTVFTSMFMHGSLLHLGGNMLFLWIFGNNVEDRLGRIGFLGFYLVGGAIAGLTQVAIDPASTIPTIGASGAIAATLGAYLVLFPRARITTWISSILPQRKQTPV